MKRFCRLPVVCVSVGLFLVTAVLSPWAAAQPTASQAEGPLAACPTPTICDECPRQGDCSLRQFDPDLDAGQNNCEGNGLCGISEEVLARCNENPLSCTGQELMGVACAQLNCCTPPTPTPTLTPTPTPTEPPVVDPCEDYSINNIQLDQVHDGIRYEFDGATATQQGNLWYQNKNSTTWVCIRNPDTAGLDPAQVTLVKDWRWLHRTDDKTLQGRIDAAEDRLTAKIGESGGSCYLCGNIRSGKGCFHPDALIQMADGTSKAARKIAAGDKLWNPVTKKAVTVERVIEGPEKLGIVELAYGGAALKVSQQHPILTGNGMKKAGELKVGDEVVDGEGRLQKLTAVTVLPVEEGQWVVNFMLDGDPADAQSRMLLAEGFVTGELVTQLELALGQE